MIIDNTKLIRSLLQFPDMDKDHILRDDVFNNQILESRKKSKCIDLRECFYTIQLLQRVKDNPTKLFGNSNFRNNRNRSIMQFQIYSVDDFDLKISNIIECAKLYQSRVYIELNLRDSKDVYAELYRIMSERFITGNYLKLHRIFNESVGQAPIMKNSRETWLIDIDTKDEEVLKNVKEFVLTLRGGGSGKKCEIYGIVPTKSGNHIITSSFELNLFKEKFPNIDVHKRNPTIVWMNTDWSNVD